MRVLIKILGSLQIHRQFLREKRLEGMVGPIQAIIGAKAFIDCPSANGPPGARNGQRHSKSLEKLHVS